ncbi:MAG: glycerol-3-phosphate dehydrogenase subunit GlpB [Bacteroidales bacterium]
MKFDTIIIGGGLSGLVSGILLAEKGQRCGVVSSGAGALYFNSGSFDLLGYDKDGNVITNPSSKVDVLDEVHPYRKIGSKRLTEYADNIKALFERMGVSLHGNEACNHYRLTPTGAFKPTFLSMDEFFLVDDPTRIPYKKVTIVNINGFLDFPSGFVAESLEKHGVRCRVCSCSIPQLEKIRQSPTEMRAVNIGREFEKPGVLEDFARELNKIDHDADVLLLPDVFGWMQTDMVKRLNGYLNVPVKIVPTLPPLVAGIRLHTLLSRYFKKLGGHIFDGDAVTGGVFDKGILKSVSTRRHGDIALFAENFILATGGIFSRGITSAPDSFYESIFGLDVCYNKARSEWFDSDFFKTQPYMSFGVKADDRFRGSLDGNNINNLYVAGAALGGVNSLQEGSGGGIALMSACHVVNDIFNKSDHGKSTI